MFEPKKVKSYLNNVIEDLDKGKVPQRPRSPWWIRSIAGPATIGLALGLGGCMDSRSDESTPEVTREEIASSKSDGMNDFFCTMLGAPRGCDLCEELDWYEDGVCDTFCDSFDLDCGPIPEDCTDDSDCPPDYQCETIPVGECPPDVLCILPPMNIGECVPEPQGECDPNGNDCPEFTICNPTTLECEPVIVPMYAVPMPECDTTTDCPPGMECDEITNTCNFLPTPEYAAPFECDPNGNDCPENTVCNPLTLECDSLIAPLYAVPPVPECDPNGNDCPENTVCNPLTLECESLIAPLYAVPMPIQCDPGNGDSDCPTDMYCDPQEVVPPNCPPGMYCILPPQTGECAPRIECTPGTDDCDATGQQCVDVSEPPTGTCPEGVFCILPPTIHECR